MPEHKLYQHTSEDGIFTLTRVSGDEDAAPVATRYALKCDKDSERAITVWVDTDSLYGLLMVLGTELVLPDEPA